MALGGGIFTNTNKVLPGAYINIVSSARSAGSVGERGVVAFAYALDWNEQGAVIEVSAEDFNERAFSIFGYPADSEKLVMFREVFRHASKIYVYNLNKSGTNATNSTVGTAKYAGIVGNSIKVQLKSINDRISNGWEINTFVGTNLIDTQTAVASDGAISGLKNNDFVTFSNSITAPDSDTDYSFTGGANGTAETSHTNAINALSVKSFNVMCAFTATASDINLYIAEVKSSRDEYGINYQLVVYNTPSVNYEGVVNVPNAVTTSTNVPAYGIVLWVAGAMSACPLNSSLTNYTYDGELRVDTNYTQAQLEVHLMNGNFVFHMVGNEVRVLDDINSYTANTAEKSREIFGFNQSIRILDQTANDIASIFNSRYNGKIPNDGAGRISLWNELVSYYKELERIRAIEGFTPNTDLSVNPVNGNRRAVKVDSTITIINTMTQLYMTVLVK